jgi:hypothetical protein
LDWATLYLRTASVLLTLLTCQYWDRLTQSKPDEGARAAMEGQSSSEEFSF